jgi:hypothetical protein
MTAGAGVVHSEMFPLLERARPNPVELFQLWLNLPRRDELAPPHFAMLWRREIPRVELVDATGRTSEVTVVAGELNGRRAPSPPPHSWAARADADVAIWSIRVPAGGTCVLPAARHRQAARTLYFFRGPQVTIGDHELGAHAAALVRPDVDMTVRAGEGEVELLLLQGRPIAEPVAQHGPFVMNTREEVAQAFADYQRTRFGGWPWPSDDPVHPRDAGRFARHADGRVERGDD